MPRLCRYSTNRSRGDSATGTCPREDSSGKIRFSMLVETSLAEELRFLWENADRPASASINKILRHGSCGARRLFGVGVAGCQDFLARTNAAIAESVDEQ